MLRSTKHNVLGVNIDAVDYEAAVEAIISAARSGQPLAATALAVHGVMTGVQDPVQRYRLNHLDLVVADGQPVRWALNWLHGVRLAERVYGPNLMLRICERASAEALPIFLYGSRQETLDALSSNLRRRFPQLVVAGIEPSRFRQLSSEEADAIAARIRTSGAAMTFVGLGCPRQEVWVYENRDRLSMPLIAVGAAFDFHAGSLAQAPEHLQRRGLEWAYRLWREPRRLWRRYVLLNPAYLGLLALQLSRLRGFDLERDQAPSQQLRYG